MVKPPRSLTPAGREEGLATGFTQTTHVTHFATRLRTSEYGQDVVPTGKRTPQLVSAVVSPPLSHSGRGLLCVHSVRASDLDTDSSTLLSWRLEEVVRVVLGDPPGASGQVGAKTSGPSARRSRRRPGGQTWTGPCGPSEGIEAEGKTPGR